MKKLQFLLKNACAVMLFSAIAAGCEQKTPETPGGTDNGAVKKHVLTVSLVAPEGYDNLPEMTVSVSNAEKELEYTEQLKGVDTKDFEVPSGQYSIVAKGKYSTTISFVGSGKSDVYDNTKATIQLSEVNKSPVVFKEIYTTSFNYKLNDTYMEIYNNSDETFYLDQLVICSMIPQLKPNPWVDSNGSLMDKYPLHGPVVAFPGSGKEYPLEPGHSVVIANDATDWAVPENNPTVNLTKADWEVYVPNLSAMADTDYDAPNLEIIYNLNNQRRLGAGFFGGAVMLAKLPDGMTPSQFAADQDNYMTTPNTEETSRYLMMPSEYLLDAVEMADASATEYFKLFLSKDDATEAKVTGWSGKSIRRKVAEIKDGRVYYKDTNNSADDFLLDQPLTPGVHPSEE